MSEPYGCPGELAPKIAPGHWMRHVRFHEVDACPLTRGDYNKYRGWNIPPNENPNDEGYLIQYPDGYVSWCPKAAFAKASRPAKDGLPYGYAMMQCQFFGKKIQRANWNGEGQFVRFEHVTAYEDGGRAYPDERSIGSDCFVFHFVNRKTGETGIQVGWLASQADMAACDWRFVE